MYKVHLAVIFKFDFWTTRRDKDINCCDIVLAYRGNLWFDDTAKLEIINTLDEVIVSQGDLHIHCKSQTEIQCSILCTYRQDEQSDNEPHPPKSLGDGLGGYFSADPMESDYFKGVDESDISGEIYDDDNEAGNSGTIWPVYGADQTGADSGTTPPVIGAGQTGADSGTTPPVNGADQTGAYSGTIPPVNGVDQTGADSGTTPPVNSVKLTY